MRDKILYFPHIRVPDNQWFTRVLLYWESVACIAPFEYSQEPEKLGPHATELVRANLVRPISPAEYVYKIPQFTEAFVSYVDSDPELARGRGRPFGARPTYLVHVEKLGHIGDELYQRDLARPAGYPWWEVERRTAIQFMAYLAGALGQVRSLSCVPATDEAEFLAAFAGTRGEHNPSFALREQLRAAILEGILPVPTESVAPKELARFKSRHLDSLQRFRRRVESSVIDVASISDTELREEKLALVGDELRDEVEEIAAQMRAAKWPRIVFGTLCSVVAAAIPGAVAVGAASAVEATGASAGLIAAIYAAFGGSDPRTEAIRSPLAYAALAERHLV